MSDIDELKVNYATLLTEMLSKTYVTPDDRVQLAMIENQIATHILREHLQDYLKDRLSNNIKPTKSSHSPESHWHKARILVTALQNPPSTKPMSGLPPYCTVLNGEIDFYDDWDIAETAIYKYKVSKYNENPFCNPRIFLTEDEFSSVIHNKQKPTVLFTINGDSYTSIDEFVKEYSPFEFGDHTETPAFVGLTGFMAAFPICDAYKEQLPPDFKQKLVNQYTQCIHTNFKFVIEESSNINIFRTKENRIQWEWSPLNCAEPNNENPPVGTCIYKFMKHTIQDALNTSTSQIIEYTIYTILKSLIQYLSYQRESLIWGSIEIDDICKAITDIYELLDCTKSLCTTYEPLVIDKSVLHEHVKHITYHCDAMVHDSMQQIWKQIMEDIIDGLDNSNNWLHVLNTMKITTYMKTIHEVTVMVVETLNDYLDDLHDWILPNLFSEFLKIGHQNITTTMCKEGIYIDVVETIIRKLKYSP